MAMDERAMIFNEYENMIGAKAEDIKKLLKRLKSYTAKNGEDREHELLVQLLTFCLEVADSRNIKKCRTLAEQIIETLENTDHWGMTEISILCSVLCHAQCTKAIELANKAMQLLDSHFPHEKGYQGLIYYNLTYALSLAYCHDISHDDATAVTEVREHFYHCMALAEAAYSGKNNETMRTVLNIRKALMDENYDAVDNGIDKLVEMKEKEWLSLTCDEIATFLSHSPLTPTSKTIQYIVGYHIKKRRKELGMTGEQLAKLIYPHYTAQTISSYDSGRRGCTLKTLYRFARALDVPIGYFFGQEAGNEFPQRGVPLGSFPPEFQQLLKQMEAVPPEVLKSIISIASGYLDMHYLAQSSTLEQK